jgi:DNA-directed RNA polymerase subunit RPC12/RpoP
MSQPEQTAILNTTLQCCNCGATLHYAPGTLHLQCTYCGTTNEIKNTDNSPIVSFDYETFVDNNIDHFDQQTEKVVSCKNCGATTTLPPAVNSDNCVFCASPLVLSEAENKQLIKPHYILPFLIPQQKALTNFRTWLKKLWFAPSDLSKLVTSSANQFKGVYIPHWSYDTNTDTQYRGQRGDYYYETETYTETVDGKQVTKTREVRRTRWRNVSGTVWNEFYDILISASKSLPQKIANRLEPWKLDALVRYNEQYVSGFRSELYQIEVEEGLVLAKRKIDPEIQRTIRRDIGGDEQSISSYDIDYNDLALKYLLLPAWISAYKYKNKVYQFTINASTGEVVGERPYSAIKITLAVMVVLGIIAIIVYCCNR